METALLPRMAALTRVTNQASPLDRDVVRDGGFARSVGISDLDRAALDALQARLADAECSLTNAPGRSTDSAGAIGPVAAGRP